MEIFQELDGKRFIQTFMTDSNGVPHVNIGMPDTSSSVMISQSIVRLKSDLEAIELAHKKNYGRIYIFASSYWPRLGFISCLIGLLLQLTTYFI